MKTEFVRIVSELREALTNKEEELRSSDKFNSFTEGKINNVNVRIVGLEASGNDIINNYSGNPVMRINFKIRSNEIKEEIEKLTC